MKKFLILWVTPILLFADILVVENKTSFQHPLFLIFTGLVLGAILMVLVCNLILYYYYREEFFLYHILMQLGIIGVLLYDTKVIAFTMITQYTGSLFDIIVSLFTLFLLSCLLGHF